MHNFHAERDQKHVVNLVDPDPAVHGLDLQKWYFVSSESDDDLPTRC